MAIIGQVIFAFLTVIMYLMLARAITSWFVKDLSNPIIRFLFEVTEPILSPVRNFLQSKNIGGTTFDFSFLIVYFLLILVRSMFAQF